MPSIRIRSAGEAKGSMGPGALRFAVLGAVRVWRDGTEVDPGPPLRRTLLALLLTRTGSTVPLPDIVDGLWSQSPPARAVNMVQRQVGELRRLLEPGLPARAEGNWLVRGAGGYRLTVPHNSVDLLRFRELAAEARKFRHDDEPERAVEAFAEALTLWHGPDTGRRTWTPMHRVFTELDLEYTIVVREAVDTGLACGRAGRVLPALSDSAARHPFDEGLQARLVLALSATGCRTEALELFRSTAARLADELGVDPGAELSAAHRRALTDDVRDIGPDTGTATGTGEPYRSCVPVPAQLPAALPVFVGRRAELDQLLTLVDSDSDRAGRDASGGGGWTRKTVRISAIAGTAGVGKTALAVHLAHRVAGRFPDGQLYVNLHGSGPVGPLRPYEVLRGFLEALGVPSQRIPSGLDARAAQYRSLLAGRRILVLVDDARDSGQIRPLLPVSSGCLAIVTSRERLTASTVADGARPLVLDVLSPAEARMLLALRLGARRVAAEPGAVDDIIGQTACLPLALAVVAARAASHPGFPLAALAAQLREAHGDPAAFHGPQDTVDVQATLSWSYDALGLDATVNAVAARTRPPVAGVRTPCA
ncbi:BTAD domain-containing putative transcriptional regulator [Streptomyces sp. NPDC047070]|uniref:AfsR/SARP family transcriptional regulator n=1 Tax=Streptomyces sp. NPDC047070 TaxID=3154923 RepID=UPI003453CEB2